MNLKRVVAWVGIVTLVGLYIAALIGALMHNNTFFSIALYSTFVIPIGVFVIEMLLKWFGKNKEIEEAIVKEALAKEAEKEGEKSIAEIAKSAEETVKTAEEAKEELINR